MPVLSKTEIAHCLPHGSGMQLIDRVSRSDEKEIVCTTQSHRRYDHPLAIHDIVPMTALIEYAAQAAGLHFALTRSADEAAPASGYIGALKDVHFYSGQVTGDELAIVATVLLREQRMALYHFSISAAGVLLVDGRISLAT